MISLVLLIVSIIYTIYQAITIVKHKDEIALLRAKILSMIAKHNSNEFILEQLKSEGHLEEDIKLATSELTNILSKKKNLQ